MIIKQNTTYSIGDILGTVDIPRDYDANSTAYFNSLSSTLTTSVKNKIDDFITGLKSAGLWDKITTILIPVYAPTKTDAFINLKTATTMTVNSVNYFTFTAGIGFNTYNATGNGIITTSKNVTDCHFGVYNTTSYAANPGSGIYQLKLGTYNLFLGKAALSGGTNIGQTGMTIASTSTINIAAGTSNVLNKSMLIGSILTASSLAFVNDNGSIYTGSTSGISSATLSTLEIHKSSSLNCGFITEGLGLTAEESQTYRTLVNTLMS